MVNRESMDYRSAPGLYPDGNFRMLLVSLLAAFIGLLAGFVAYGLYSVIAFLSNLIFFQRISLIMPSLQNNTLGLWVILVPVAGGLVVGWMARYGSPKIRGHGIPEAMEAVLTNQSRIEPRVAILKPISAAISIGTGGPFGAEGPIIQTGGALGSLVGQFLHTTATERKVLLACGAAAGMAATFSTPIAGVILAIELLLFEFKPRSFIPLVISSTLATTVHFMLMGRGPMLNVTDVDFGIPGNLFYYLILGLLCGLVAVVFSNALYWVEDQFEKLPIHWQWWPALGGLGLGIIGFFFPRVLGVGYDTISDILNGHLGLQLLLLVLIFKSLALLISLGSGTSGGLLAPMLMAGAALGGAFAMIVNQLIPGANLSPAAFALVGMAAVFGSAAQAVFTFIIFAFEITRDYNAILPLMLVCVVADGVAILFMRNSIMTEKLVRRGLRIPVGYEADVLQQVSVEEVMDRQPVILPAEMPVRELADKIAGGEARFSSHQAFLIANAQSHLVGIITRGDVLRTLEIDLGKTVLEAGNDNLVVTYPDESLHDAVAKMVRNDIGRLPVVNRDETTKPVGYLGRRAVFQARLRRHDDEHKVQPGWLAGRGSPP
jgi:CIC family chloride channel protein